MLAVIVVAALAPNIGVGAAQVNAQYQNGPAVNNTLEYALIGVLVAAIVAALVGLLIFRQRRNRGGGGAGAVAAWEEPQGGGTGPSTESTEGGGAGGAPPGSSATYGATGAAVYDESATSAETAPEWAEPAAPAGAAVGGAGPVEESEPDIDRLMKELDQISDDILKKTPPKKGSPPEPSPDDADADA